MSEENSNTRNRPKRSDLFHVNPNDIIIEEGFNPRVDYGDLRALADSIIANGVKVPVRGFKKDGEFVLTDGHRRLKAVFLLLKDYPDAEILIPFIIDPSEKSAEQRIIDVMICNDGLKLNPLEEAEIVNRLVNFGMSDKDIAKRTAQTKVYVSNLKLLYSAPEKIKNRIREGMVSATLVLDVLRNSEDFSDAIDKIEGAVEFVGASGKDKVVKKDLQQSLGKQNSYSALKKCYKSVVKSDRVVKDDKVELFDFLEKIINGELSKEELESYLFED